MFLAASLIFSVFAFGCGKQEDQNKKEMNDMEQQFTDFVADFESQAKPLHRKASLAYFNASIENKDELWNEYAENDKKFNTLLSNKDYFNKLKSIKESGEIKDTLMKRHLDVLYNAFLGKQIDTAKLNRLTDMQTAIEGKYAKFRTEVDGKKLSDNEVEEVLKTSNNSEELKRVWLAHKDIGPLVADDIREMVKLRNEMARELGFDNYHTMALRLSEQDPEEIDRVFNELDELTRDSYKEIKNEIDEAIAKKLGISKDQLQPWHYQNRFFQEAPSIYEVNLDTYYDEHDIVELTKTYFASLNMPIDTMVAKSDLYEKEGKNQHAYCINIDRDAKDIRVLCNVKPNARWMETMLHEYGHALYEYYYREDLPWALKEPAHIFTTEAIAMLFGRFASNPQWIKEMLEISDEEHQKISEVAPKVLRMQQLVFSRWSQVMYRFEKQMYANPDQDLNKLWWDLVEQYQMIRKPEGRDMPDWATKIHIATVPCYYHNYLLGELLASQLYYKIAGDVLNENEEQNLSFKGRKEAGDYLIDNVFAPGKKYTWNEMIKKATGEELTPKYYAKQFVK
ncbi:MAG: M2 family metallopeptidase [Candidatus Kapaibacterium sp.]